MTDQNNIIQFNKFAKLHNGKNVFFCKTDYLLELFDSLKHHDVPSVLISGNSDYSMVDDLVSLAPDCIVKWFAQCVNTNNLMVKALPYGLENTENCILEGHGQGWIHARERILAAQYPLKRPFSRDLYANFSLTTHPIRLEVKRICESLPYVTTRITYNYMEMNNNPYQQYVSEILDHKMTVCPRGNAAAETHRFWEVLYMGRVPIIKINKGNSFFTELPVVVLESWEQLNDLAFLHSEYENVKNNSKEMLKMSYWENLILKEIDELK